MKKFVFGLIMMLFAFSTLPVQANAPDDGVKTEIVKATAFDFINVTEVSFEVPQVHFYNHCNYRPAELWNYNSTNFNFETSKKMSTSKTLIIDNRNALCNTFNFLKLIKNCHYFKEPVKHKNLS